MPDSVFLHNILFFYVFLSVTCCQNDRSIRGEEKRPDRLEEPIQRDGTGTEEPGVVAKAHSLSLQVRFNLAGSARQIGSMPMGRLG